LAALAVILELALVKEALSLVEQVATVVLRRAERIVAKELKRGESETSLAAELTPIAKSAHEELLLFLLSKNLLELFAVLSAMATTWSARALLVTPWAMAAFSEASVFEDEQASMALPTLSSTLRQAPKACVQFFLAIVKFVLRSEMSQAAPLIFEAAMASSSAVQS